MLLTIGISTYTVLFYVRRRYRAIVPPFSTYLVHFTYLIRTVARSLAEIASYLSGAMSFFSGAVLRVTKHVAGTAPGYKIRRKSCSITYRACTRQGKNSLHPKGKLANFLYGMQECTAVAS